MFGLLAQTVIGRDVGRPGGTGVDGIQPLGGLAVQVAVVGEIPPRQEVARDELDQAFDAAFLIGGTRGTRLGVEPELPRELEQGWGPDGLIGVIPPRGDDFPVVENQHPRDPAQDDEAIHQSAEQRLLAHVGRPANPHPPTVFEPTRQEVARRARALAEWEAGSLAPIDLQILPR